MRRCSPVTASRCGLHDLQLLPVARLKRLTRPPITLRPTCAASLAFPPADLSASGAPHEAADNSLSGEPGAEPVAIPIGARALADGKAWRAASDRSTAQPVARRAHCGCRTRRCGQEYARHTRRTASSSTHD